MNENTPQEILLASDYKNKLNSTLGDIAKCIGSDNPVVIANLDEPIGSQMASIMVLEFEIINENKIVSFINMQLKSTVWNHMAKFLIINQGSMANAQSITLQKFFFTLGIYNVAIVHKFNDIIFVEYSNTIRNDFHSTNLIENGHRFFPDKLKNLQKYLLKIPVVDEAGIVNVNSKNIESPLLHFINILQEKMNITPLIFRANHGREIASYWLGRGMDLTFNTFVTFDGSEVKAPKLMTYNQDGYCAMVPLSEKTAIFGFIFLKPFDVVIWICFALSIVVCMLIWWLFYNRGTQDSHWLLMFGIFAMFVSQGVEIRRTRRYVLLILLQLIVSMVFVLSNGYQGVITSFMIQPLQENKLETFQDVLNSNYRIIVSEVFGNIIKESPDFQSKISRIEVNNMALTPESAYQYSKKNVVLILKCKTVEQIINVDGYEYYILKEKLMTYLEELEASFLNPIIDKMQYYMDLSFQSGLQQAWELFTWKNHKIVKIDNHIAEYLELKDLVQVFYILFIGYGLGVMVFLIEIFFHDFIDKLSLKYQTLMIRKFINHIGTVKQLKPVLKNNKKQLHKLKKPRVQRPKVRKIRVESINVEI